MAPKRKRTSPGKTYQVFLSFRGSDTRQGFTDVIFHALMDAGIHVFRDDEEIRKGEQIGEEILRAIDESMIFVPIFSRGYASSKWCLRELAEMLKSKEASGGKKKILPIFYDVSVNDVKLKTDQYARALSEHREKFNSETVQQWEEALLKAGKINGYELKDKGHGVFAKSFVKEVSLKLKVKHTLVTDYLIQRDDQVEELVKLLEIASSDVRFVGICGMGGIGKTTLAKVVFNKLCNRFDHSCFLADVRESSQQKGIEKLQKQVLDSTGLRSEEIMHKDDGVMKMSKMLAHKNLLLALDDVGHLEQIQYLAGDGSWFGSGSRIIITTRDQTVLRNDVQILEAEVMKPEEALRLFSMHAFDKDSPPNDFLTISQEAVESTGRLPLSLEVIGSQLSNQSRKEWVATIKKLKEVPHKDVQKKLMISYEALDHAAKQIFLDIACFFIGYEKRYPMYMWEACGFDRNMGLRELIQMSLVKVSGRYKTLWMHDQLRDLGRNIVNGERFLNNVTKCSRLWRHEDALRALQVQEGNENIEMLRISKYDSDDPDDCFTESKFSRLRKLRYLECDGAYFSGDLKHLPPNLTWLSWRDFRMENFMATSLCLRNLVVLELFFSDIREDWGGWRQIGAKLKVLELEKCYNLNTIPDLSNYSSLERLIIEDCSQLVEIDPSIGKVEGLKFLHVSGCNLITGLGYDFEIFKLPESIGRLSRLRRVSLMHCRGLNRFPDSLAEIESLVELDLSYTDIVELSLRKGQLLKLEILNLSYCEQIRALPNSIGNLMKLRVIRLSGSYIRRLPSSIGLLKRLEQLHADWCPFLEELPPTIKGCTRLRVLNLRFSAIRRLPKLPDILTDQSLHHCRE